jgi:hypothetical protein
VALALVIGIWGVFLAVTLVRKRAEYRADSSIGAFQRQLSVLRRNSERIYGVPSVRVQDSQGRYAPERSLAAVRASGVDGDDEVDIRSPRYDEYYEEPIPRMGRHAPKQDPYFRREARERRRDVLLILISALVGTGLVSIIPAARMALVVTAICGLALMVYVVLLVRLKQQAFEREMKLRYMPRAQPQARPAPAFADRRVAAR